MVNNANKPDIFFKSVHFNIFEDVSIPIEPSMFEDFLWTLLLQHFFNINLLARWLKYIIAPISMIVS